MNEIYTIGYTAFSIEEFIEVLNKKSIKCLIDIRSTPFSQHYTDYNKDILEKQLKEYNILYRNYAKEFGARQEDKSFFASEGYLDFEKFVNSVQFREGFLKVSEGLKMGYSFAFMCAEKDPINCHRSIMVGKAFKDYGFIVKHILSSETIETQEQLENRLLDMYYKSRQQLSFFSKVNNEAELISEAYKKRNIEIGFKLEDE